MSVDMSILTKFAQKADGLSMTTAVSYWDRTERYRYDDVLRECDAFVMILPSNAWSVPLKQLPPGCIRELNSAIASKRKLYITYIPSDGQVGFYQAEVIGTAFTGVRGSSNELMKEVQLKMKKHLGTFTDVPAKKGADLDVEKVAILTDPSRLQAWAAYSKGTPKYEKRLLLKKRKK